MDVQTLKKMKELWRVALGSKFKKVLFDQFLDEGVGRELLLEFSDHLVGGDLEKGVNEHVCELNNLDVYCLVGFVEE